MDEIGERIEYNRHENERYFQAVMKGMSYTDRVEFQLRLLDGMFSVIEAADFKMLCVKAVRDMTEQRRRLDAQASKIVQ